MIKVIVTQRLDYIEGYKETRDAIDQKLSQWLIQAGLLPVPVSNKLVVIYRDKDAQENKQPMLQSWLSAINPNALLLSGGNDIGSVPLRDLTENYLLSWAEKNRLPVLGICRGMQMIGVWGGGQLIQQEGHVGTRHKLQVNGMKDEWSVSVNSFHNHALIKCPNQFITLASSEEGSLEAMKHEELPWEAWMWHPEREEDFSVADQLRFIRLLKSEK